MNELKVKVRVSELLQHLKQNKKEHKKEYTMAVGIYLDKVDSILREYTVSLEKEELREDGYRVFLTAPVDNTVEYNKYIAMLEMSTEAYIVIDTEQFNNFVKDDWPWAVSAKISNSVYLSSQK